MKKHDFSNKFRNLVTMVTDGSNYEDYCNNNDLGWFVPQLKVLELAFNSGLFLKEELLAFFSLPAHEHEKFKDEMTQLCEHLETLNAPVTAVISRRTIH
ncbi:hypothetical protein UA32_12175 [Photobacterium angustum]|uniref:Uncharacterized protein n=1 Tax=Photobacterium angustum TaxID=661 RepID=A0ABX5GZ72_PHOAN|nr:hypothetical protein [Photobacterium angustum]KJG37712.1 hypothetical protein UA32_12175 [Photobacterium angustum]PSX03956.1 hypothetical protein C0W27_20905 [Photobacterium angustum]